MEPKVTIMVLKVDLQCSCCYKKVKRLLCKYPQIRDQVFDEKNNTVTIKVVCCSPEKIRDKLCSKGGKSIKSIEIKEPPKPKPPQSEPAKPKPPPEAEKPKAAPTGPAPPEKQPKPTPEAPKPKSDAPKPAAEPAPKPAAEQPKQMQSQGMLMPVQGYPPVYPVPICCGSCYHGQPGGPCYQEYGGMPPPRPGCDPYAYGGGAYRTGYYPSRCDYFSEENPAACAIM